MLSYSLSAAVHDLGKGRPGDILYIHHAPDPVNVRTGNFYLPLQDYYQSCFNLPIEVYRSYNSFSTENGVFGKGWTFNFDIKINVSEQAGLQIIEADGFLTTYQPKEKNSVQGSVMDRILAAKKSEDTSKSSKKTDDFYSEYAKRLGADKDFLKRQKALYLPGETLFSPSGNYVSSERGKSTLEETKETYVRILETGRKEVFNKQGRLLRVEDRNQNVLRISYDKDNRIGKITDTCEQSLTIKYNKAGKIEKLSDSKNRSVSYAYNPDDYLISHVALDGQKIQYTYDKLGRMTSVMFTDGSQTKVVYDEKTSRVLKQIGPGTKITTYKYGKEAGTVWTSVEDTQGEKNKYEYVEAENKTIHTDKAGNKTITTHNACCGKPLTIKNVAGKGDTFTYDENGNLLSRTNALNQTSTFKYDPRFNLPNEVKDHTGKSIRYVYDQNGNMTFSKTSDNEYVKLTYEPHGKISTMVDHGDNQIKFFYDKIGNPVSVEKWMKDTKNAAIKITYDASGDVAAVVSDPTGDATIASIKNTLTSLFNHLKPIGIEFNL